MFREPASGLPLAWTPTPRSTTRRELGTDPDRSGHRRLHLRSLPTRSLHPAAVERGRQHQQQFFVLQQQFAPCSLPASFPSTGQAFNLNALLERPGSQPRSGPLQVTTRSVNLTAPVRHLHDQRRRIGFHHHHAKIGGSSAALPCRHQYPDRRGPPSGVAFAVNGTVTQDRRYVILELNGLTLQSVVITTVNIQQPNPQIQIPGTTGTTGLTGITGSLHHCLQQ